MTAVLAYTPPPPDATPTPRLGRLAALTRPVGLGLILFGLLLPLVPVLLWAVAESWRFPALLPTQFGTSAVRSLNDPGASVISALLTSLTIATTVSLLAAVMGLCAGRALGLYCFRGKRVVQFLVLAPVIVPPFSVVLGVQVLFIRYGLADTIPGVVVVQLIPTIPYVTLVMASVYANYDTAYEEQARVLGAGPRRVLLTVTLPQVFPGLVVAALFAFLISWSEYILTLLIGGGSVTTLPLLLFASLGGSDTPQTAALALVIVTPPMLLLVFTSRFLSGSSPSAVAGFGRL
ncbi:MAG: ABC transporter permease [Mycobacteriales bacterium]